MKTTHSFLKKSALNKHHTNTNHNAVQSLNQIERKRKNLFFYTSHWVGLTCIVILISIGIKQKSMGIVAFDSFCFVVAAGNMLFLKIFNRPKISFYLAVVYIGILFFLLYTSNLTGNSALLWYYVYPSISFSLMGLRIGLISSISLLVGTLVYAVIQYQDGNAILLFEKSQENVRFIASYICVALLFFLYEYYRLIAMKELKKRIEQTEKVIVERNSFFSQMSHALKTPLSGVITTISILSNKPFTKDIKILVSLAHKSSIELLTLINELLNIKDGLPINKANNGPFSTVSTQSNSNDVFKQAFNLANEKSMLSTYASPVKSTSEEQASPPTSTKVGKKSGKISILLTDDNHINRTIISHMLKMLGSFNIDIAHNGLEALNYFKQNKYHFILMDCHMPIMNGYDATRAIRQEETKNPNKQSTPIIAITANSLDVDKQKCFECGMNNFLSKPILKDKLQNILNTYT